MTAPPGPDPQDAGRAIESRYRDLVETSQDLIWTVDVEGRFSFVNQAARTILGYEPEEMMGRPFTDFETPEQAAKDLETFRSVLEGAPQYQYETQHIRKDGTLVDLSYNAIAWHDSEGEPAGATGTARDISDQVRSAAALRDAEAQYRGLIERLPAISFIAEAGARGQWFYVSPQIEEILGFTQEEWLADPGLWQDRLHPLDRDRVLAEEANALHGNNKEPAMDYRMIAADGRVVWVRDEAHLHSVRDRHPVWRGMLSDITDIKTAEAELARGAAAQEAVARLGRHALENMPLPALMREGVNAIAEVLGVPVVHLLQLDREGGGALLRAGVGWPADVVGALRLPGERGGFVGRVLTSPGPVIVDDWDADPSAPRPASPEDSEVKSSIAARIEGPAHPFGVMVAHSPEAAPFGLEDVTFVQSVANLLADAIARRASEDEIRHQALHEPLTGLPNRVLFLDRLGHALARSTRSGTAVAVLFLDIDNFKLVNDTLGHPAGDELLVAIAPRLRQATRPSDTVARFGGDEFGLLIEDINSEADAVRVAERIAASFARPFLVGGVEHFVTASVGIALARAGEDAPQALIRDADAAMYRAKDRGRARYELFDQAMRARAIERLGIENGLRRALEREELRVHYQPILGIASGEIQGLEALVRWQHPERGLIEPAEFISVAEESGLIEPIGQWVLEQACREAAAWHDEHPDGPPLSVSVNVSGRQLANPGLAASLAQTLRRHDLDPRCLSLEITETVLIEEGEVPVDTLESLKELGVSLVLDDFGTGYSALGYLKRFELDALKIDRSFVKDLDGEDGRAIVEAVIGMARALSLKVIAEGVESAPQLEQLAALGCHAAQGYYFSRPLPADEVRALLWRGRLRR